MPSLILEFGSIRQGTDLIDAHTSIGRGADNTVVVDHPTVSRIHAWLVREDEENAGDFLIRDTGSANGTYVDGERVRGKQPLRDGALIRIGPARMVFRSAPLAEVEPSLTIDQKPRLDADGVTFSCDCGARLWIASRRVGRTGTCPTCKKQLTYPIAEDLELSTAEIAPAGIATVPMTVPIIAMGLASSATELCSICQSEIASCDNHTACPACGLRFHADCWTENCGCSAYGCAQVNALAPKVDEDNVANEAETPATDGDTKPFVPEWVEPANRFPWEFALLAASVLGTLIGLLAFGVPPLLVAAIAAVMAMRRREDPDRRTGVVAACVGLALIGTALGVMISSWWWFGSKPL